MNNSLITVTASLPSKGLIYPEKVDPVVTIRTATSAEEALRLSHTDYPYRTMSGLIRDCIVDNSEINPYDLCFGDYLFLLHQLRIVTYGSEYNTSTVCPFCGHTNEDVVDLNCLILNEYDESILKYTQFELPRSKCKVTIKYQTPRMLDIVSDKVRNYKKKSTKKDLNMELIYTIALMIDTIDDKHLDIMELEKWANNLPMLDVQTILAYADKLNGSIGYDRHLQVVCNTCGLPYDTSFRTTSEFFRPTINI